MDPSSAVMLEFANGVRIVHGLNLAAISNIEVALRERGRELLPCGFLVAFL